MKVIHMQKNLRQLIHKKRVNFLELNTMSADGIEIQNLIGNLDEVVVFFEAKWGAMRLPEIISPAVLEKWNRQFDKLCGAIESNDVVSLRDLVPGTIRAYYAMEADAMAQGHKPYDPVFWEIQLPDTNRVIRLVKNNADAAMVKQAGVEAWTLQEVARLIAATELAARPEAVQRPLKSKREPFDFKTGDEVL